MGGGMLAGNSLASILILRDGNRLFVVSDFLFMISLYKLMLFGDILTSFSFTLFILFMLLNLNITSYLISLFEILQMGVLLPCFAL